MHRNVRAVVAAGAERGIEVVPRSYPEGTKTAEDAAAAIGVEVGQIVKSLVFLVDGEPTLALVAGHHRLDERKLAAAAGAARVDRADAAAVRAATGFPIGGVPPFPAPGIARVFVDGSLLDHAEVWAAAGTWTDVFPLRPEDLVRATAGTVVELARSEG